MSMTAPIAATSIMNVMPVFATTPATGGTITVTSAIPGAEYTAYKLLNVTVTEDGTGYAYTATDEWLDFLTTNQAATDIFTVNATTKSVKPKNGVQPTDTQMAALARAADAVKVGKTSAQTATCAEGSNQVDLAVTDNGYYLITSSAGLVAMGLSVPGTENITINEKNTAPSVDKTIVCGDTSDTNDVQIGDTVDFSITINVTPNTENYVLHDKMSAGLQLQVDTLKVDGAASNVGWSSATGGDTDDGCSFEITFANDYLTDKTSIGVTYSATVTAEAAVGNEGNSNEAHLKYGDDGKTVNTPSDKTTTYTWEAEILKYANGKKENTLEEVTFYIYKKDTDGTKHYLKVDENSKFNAWDDSEQNASTLTTGSDGKISVKGLDSGTYYLHEIAPLPGYNALDDDHEFKIEPTKTNTQKNNSMSLTPKIEEIENNSGQKLPETGGMGTTMLYVAGGALLIGSAVFYMTNKKMKKN